MKEQVGVSAQHVQGHVVTIRECVRDLISIKDMCVWAAVDDEMWNQIAGVLGAASLQKNQLVGNRCNQGTTSLRLVHPVSK